MEARELYAENRECFLERIRTSDPGMHAELQALLAGTAEADEFFEGLTKVVAQLRESPDLDPRTPPTSDLLIGELIDHYRIESKIGSGGMGTVYMAHDTKLERPVALKFLPKHVSSDGPTAERFLLEARAAAALDHANVCTIHEIGEADGRRYIAMAYYEGETLREILARGPLSLELCAEYARQIGAALGAAHRRGIVHRDVKPSNVIVTPEGVVKVLDFGLAKLTDVTITGEHQTLGTIAYMAPEQLLGGQIDARVDLWALGVVWYEMLTGRRPFPGPNATATAHQILHENPPALLELRPDASEETSRLIQRLLQRNADDRPESAEAVLSGKVATTRTQGRKRAASMAVLLLALLGAAYGGISLRGSATAPPAFPIHGEPHDDSRPSVAVLPFADLRPASEPFFSEGLTGELTGALAGIRGLRVAGHTSVFEDYGEAAGNLGDRLGVEYLVKGIVNSHDDRLEMIARLIDATDGFELWSQRYERDRNDIFAIQAEIARAVAGQLRVPLPENGPLLQPTDDLEAYEHYLEGRARLRLRGVGLREAIAAFRAAIARDSNWAPPWAGLAEASELKIWHNSSFTDEYAAVVGDSLTRGALWAFVDRAHSEAEYAARRALELDPTSTSALVALGSVQRNRAEWVASEASYQQALALDPDDPEAHQQYADLLYNMGRIAESVRMAEGAYQLDPAPIRAETFAFSLQLDGRPEEAVELFEEALQWAPRRARPRLLRNAKNASLAAGRFQQTVDWWNELDSLSRAGAGPSYDRLEWRNSRADLEAFVGAVLSRDLSRIPEAARATLGKAWHWMMLGEPDSATAKLLEIVSGPPFGRTSEIWHPTLDPIRNDPRIQALLVERGLEGIRVQRTADVDLP